MNGIIGRSKEIARLKKALESPRSEFLALYGRRRVGKTFLVRSFFEQNFDFQLTGLANASTDQQLSNFQAAFRRIAPASPAGSVPQNWIEAFGRLRDHLEGMEENRKKIIFLDELPWLDTARSDFMTGLEHFWNAWASGRKDILLITCGSAAAWMLDTLIHSHGGLHNRVTGRIPVQPFSLYETELMLRSQGHTLDRYQIVQLYMAMGGIPFYLEAAPVGKSAWQIVEELCFRPEGFLKSEFPHLFTSLFRNATRHELIVMALAGKSKGMTRQEIAAAAKLPSGGSLSKWLHELETSGFISTYGAFNKKSKDTLYRLSDFYSLFYLRFLNGQTRFDPGYWINSIDSPAHRAWAGYTFEQVCLNHIPQIKQGLQIAGVQSQSGSWKSKASDPGAQVDLLIDRRDQVINLCEIKYALGTYTITKAYAAQLRNKAQTFRDETKTRKAIFTTLITTHGAKKNAHFGSAVQNELTMEVLFLPSV